MSGKRGQPHAGQSGQNKGVDKKGKAKKEKGPLIIAYQEHNLEIKLDWPTQLLSTVTDMSDPKESSFATLGYNAIHAMQDKLQKSGVVSDEINLKAFIVFKLEPEAIKCTSHLHFTFLY